MTSLLITLKKTVPAVLLIGSLSLALAPSTQAQITFTVDEFTTDTLTITLQAGTLDFSSGNTTDTKNLYLLDADDINTDWISSNSGPTFGSGGAFGAVSYDVSFAQDNGVNNTDHLMMVWLSDLTSAGSLASNFTLSFTGSGIFTPTAVNNFSLYWGHPSDTATFQSTTANPSAVPEPGSFAALAGLAGLGFTLCRRRRRTPITA